MGDRCLAKRVRVSPRELLPKHRVRFAVLYESDQSREPRRRFEICTKKRCEVIRACFFSCSGEAPHESHLPAAFVTSAGPAGAKAPWSEATWVLQQSTRVAFVRWRPVNAVANGQPDFHHEPGGRGRSPDELWVKHTDTLSPWSAFTSAASSKARSPATCRYVQATRFELAINRQKPLKDAGPQGAADAARPRRRGDRVKRREFITLIGGAAALAARGARAAGERVRRIGHVATHSRRTGMAPAWAFLPRVGVLGHLAATCASTPAGPRPTPPTSPALRPNWPRSRPTSSWRRHDRGAVAARETRTVPVVFPAIVDPVGAGFVDSLARPGGNATGFTEFEYSIGGEMAGAAQGDRARRDASGVLRNPRHRRSGQFGGSSPWRRRSGWSCNPGRYARRARSSAPSRPSRRAERRPDRRRAVGAAHRELIVTLAARHRLPAIYWDRVIPSRPAA